MKFKLKIVTPERVLYSDLVDQVSVLTSTGQITILSHHLPLVSQLVPGEVIIIKDKNEEELMVVSGGLVEVLSDQVVILADTAERAVEIDEARAEAARQKAVEILRTKVQDAEQFAYFTAQLEKELARLRVVRKHKNKKNI